MIKRKGIIGGTFDPVHNGHIDLAYDAMKLLKLEKILFIPAGNPPHKVSKVITDSDIRIDLLKRAIENEHRFELCTYEIQKKGLSYTYETLMYLKNKEPETQWYFITGADCLIQIDTWKNVETIMSLCNFVVFTRPGYDLAQVNNQKDRIEKKYKKNIILLESSNINISSTELRNMIKEKKDIRKYVSIDVYNRISELKLYS